MMCLRGAAPSSAASGRIRSCNSAMTVSAMMSFPGSTDDRRGVRNPVSLPLSKPMTCTSSGTRNPRSARARSAPSAAASVSANAPSNGTPDSCRRIRPR
ncbi:hypothetical protein D7319_23775 [Streptomyces radicis]|uniref:Uncharacterized protein n=1 Tax=Streptomyces radicis TaxID=1750517 RepID=A0A3A9VZ19_9ACTN|nr:hypothetical protein D7319_23775 [Streptomyces radicis]RKN17712.1 hypothetical protein D7318_22935 [Streptomyces radicis]